MVHVQHLKKLNLFHGRHKHCIVDTNTQGQECSSTRCHTWVPHEHVSTHQIHRWPTIGWGGGVLTIGWLRARGRPFLTKRHPLIAQLRYGMVFHGGFNEPALKKPQKTNFNRKTVMLGDDIAIIRKGELLGMKEEGWRARPLEDGWMLSGASLGCCCAHVQHFPCFNVSGRIL